MWRRQSLGVMFSSLQTRIKLFLSVEFGILKYLESRKEGFHMDKDLE